MHDPIKQLSLQQLSCTEATIRTILPQFYNTGAKWKSFLCSSTGNNYNLLHEVLKIIIIQSDVVGGGHWTGN